MTKMDSGSMHIIIAQLYLYESLYRMVRPDHTYRHDTAAKWDQMGKRPGVGFVGLYGLYGLFGGRWVAVPGRCPWSVQI